MEKIDKIDPGEGMDLSIPAPPPGTKEGYIILEYKDEYGNEYETKILIDFINFKILKQEYRKISVVKDVGDKIPRLQIDEKSFRMMMRGVNESNTEIIKEK